MPSLSESFLPHAPAALRGALAAEADLEPLLGALLSSAHEEHPGFGAPDADFLRYAAQRLPAGLPPRDALTALRPGELYLACCCCAQLPAALETFDRLFAPVIAQVVSRRGGDKVTGDEVPSACAAAC